VAVQLSADQYELLGDGDGAGLLFGTQSTGFLTVTVPSKEPGDPGGSEYARDREDGVHYGEEWEGASAVTFDVQVLADRALGNKRRAAEDALDLFESTWRSERWRGRFGAYAMLRSNIGGTVRRCYGRPRRFAATEDGSNKRGLASFLCDFSVMDGKWYDDVTKTASTPTSTAGVTRFANMTVGGTRETWPVIRITAGTSLVRNPSVRVGNYGYFDFDNLTISPRGSFTIDPQPWRRRFVINDDPTLATNTVQPTGASTLLQDFRLPQGNHTITLNAETLPSDARVSVEWRNAWSRW
jgi:hypothetical protein